jgi:hypothetical protein
VYFQKRLKDEGIHTEANLVNLIKRLKNGEQPVEATSEPTSNEEVPEEELTEEQKKKLKFVTSTKQGKIKKAIELERQQADLDLKYKENPQEFVASLRQKRAALLEKRDKKKRELVQQTSRSFEAKKLRMKYLFY